MNIMQEQQTITNTKIFQIKLSSSRIIYHPDSSGATVTVTNPQKYPILIRGQVFAEDKKSTAPFIVTPPLSRLEAQQRSRLRIISTDKNATNDQETLYWFCVAGIPPKDTDVWAQGDNGKRAKPKVVTLNLEVSAHECIKIMVRPSNIKGTMMESAAGLQWHRQGDQLAVHNPSPFYMNLSSVTVGGKPVTGMDYVAPGASRSFGIAEGSAGEVHCESRCACRVSALERSRKGLTEYGALYSDGQTGSIA